jgi:F0F1-type ATP synthase membrane subunit c/vacuolar-type H+-ATPase subunit K
MKTESKAIIQNAIAANLAALTQRLAQATALAKEAQEAMEQGEQNQAIGTILDFDRLLPETLALYNAAIALHRGRN